jgi:hypothetical protein
VPFLRVVSAICTSCLPKVTGELEILLGNDQAWLVD